MKIEVNDKFIMTNNLNRTKNIVIKNKIDDDVFECQIEGDSFDNGRIFTATKNTISTWTKIEDVIKNANNTYKRKRNLVPLIKVCIQVLKDNISTELTATEIYKIIKENNLFVFSDKAKTPANTVHARIREYMKKQGDNSEIVYSLNKKGKFAYHKVS